MAGLSAPFRPSSSSSQSFSSRRLLLLTVLPLTLALFAFMLQWRGGLDDPESRWPVDGQKFPGISPLGPSPSSSSPSLSSSLSSSDCLEILGRSSSPSFPYFRGVKFDFDSDPRPKICITSSTSASLEQILPWLFYHKAIGVSTFFLFVEGKAAKPNVSAVLESIPGVKVIYRTRDLEEKQAKRMLAWIGSFILTLMS